MGGERPKPGADGACPIRSPMILLLLFLLLWATLAPARATALGPEQLALIVNTADPYSVEIGAYYARRRGIPSANVVFVTLPVGPDEISRQEFEAARAEAAARLPATVQALALAWTTPFRVDCLSITTAFAFGFDPAFCAQGCRPTRRSPYFNSPSRAPFSDLAVRPAMLLAGRTVAEGKALVRGRAPRRAVPRPLGRRAHPDHLPGPPRRSV